ncbi:MAG TPA: MarR family transcriptional regulator [Stellaceae bacterium]|nr:MarR family transcriptional regulator [Stellaceae bacterium]
MSDLSSALLFLLSRAATSASGAFEARELGRHNVTLAMYRVLVTLARHDDQRLGDLAALAEVEMSTLSRLIGTMQARRLVTRRRSGKDARAVRIRISDQGRALAGKLAAAATTFETALSRGLAAREQQALKRGLERIGETAAVMVQAPAAPARKSRPPRRARAA